MSLLCGRIRPTGALTTVVAPPMMLNVVPFRMASLGKSQKKTLEKYGNRAAKSGKKGDFLSNAKNTMQGKTGGKKAGKEPDAPPAPKVALFSGGASGAKVDTRSEKDLEEAATIALVDSEVNQEYNWHDFNLTEQRYEEYEALKGSKAREGISEDQLREERAAYIKRLWEPYETETFNLKSLIGDSPSSDDIVREQNRYDKPSKMLYYSNEELDRYLPEGLAGKINKTFNWPGFTHKAVMVRPMVESIIAWLEGWKQRQFLGRKNDEDFYTLLSGPLGSGKSALLNPIVHWARLSGWLVVFVPDGKDWAGFPRKNSGVEKMLSYSKVNECWLLFEKRKTWFGQPHLATAWITALIKAHGDKLEQIHLRTEFTVRDVDPDKPTFTSGPEHTLKTLLDYGLKHPQQASDCVWYLRQELCTVTEFPVLIVVDAVNAIRDRSKYGDPIDPYIFAPHLDTSRLVLTRAFQEYRNHGLVNGLYVGAAVKKRRNNPDLLRTRYDYDSRLSLTKVPPLSRFEAHILSDWYRENNVYSSDVPSQTVDYMWAMSQGNGDAFWKQAESV